MVKIYLLLKKLILNSLYRLMYKNDEITLCLGFAFKYNPAETGGAKEGEYISSMVNS